MQVVMQIRRRGIPQKQCEMFDERQRYQIRGRRGGG